MAKQRQDEQGQTTKMHIRLSMENRKSTRVRISGNSEEHGQETNLGSFREAALPGLVVDISSAGIQILTDRTFPFDTDLCRITVPLLHGDSAEFLANQKWSKEEGTLYIRNGFAFDSNDSKATESARKVLSAHQQGVHWLQCSISEAVAGKQFDSANH